MRWMVCGGYVGNVDLRWDVISESMQVNCGGRVSDRGGVGVVAGTEVGGGGREPVLVVVVVVVVIVVVAVAVVAVVAVVVDCGAVGLFSLLVSDDGLDRRGSVGDDGSGAKKLSGRSESAARGTDEGRVVADGKGAGGGGGGGRLGMGNSS